MKSLEKQLSYTLTLSLVGIFVAFWWVMTYTIHELTERYVVTRLEHDAETLLKHLEIKEGQWHLSANAAEVIYQRPRSGHYYLIKSKPPALIRTQTSPSLEGYLFYSPVSESLADAVYETHEPDSFNALVLRVPFEYQGYRGYLFVAEDHSPIQESLKTFDVLFALFSLFGLAALLWTQRRILKKGFDSLQPVKQALNDVQEGKQVAIQAEVPSEIEPLVDTLNQALSQLQARLARSRQATGNLAHALKSPLNLIYQLLDDQRLDAHPQLKQALQEQAQRLHDLIERELSLAKTAGRGMTLNTFRFPEDLDDLTATMAQLYRDKALHFETHIDVKHALPFDREDLFELLGNLLENAAKWCRQTIRIVVKTDQACLVLQIEDDGPGVAQSLMEQMQQRGTRLDESRPGHGLGLSIVKQIVEAYSGEVIYSQGERFIAHTPALSGLQVTIKLPLI